MSQPNFALTAITRRISPDDGVAELEAFPIAPGESPFKLKGVAYRGHIDYVNEHVAGGMSAMIERIPDPRMRKFWTDTTFLAASLYDVVPLAYAGVVCGRMTGKGFLPFVQARSEAQVLLDTQGVYRHLLSLVSPSAVVQRMPQIVSQYTTFARSKIEWAQGDVIVSSHEKIPRAVAPWWVTVTDTYVRAMLRRAGAREVELTYEKPVLDGSQAGVPLVTISMMGIVR